MAENEHPVWAELRDMQEHERVSSVDVWLDIRLRLSIPPNTPHKGTLTNNYDFPRQ